VQKDHIHRLTFSMAQTSTICVVKREKRKRKEKRKKEKEKEKGKERYGPLSRLASVNLFDYKIQVLPQQCIMSNNLIEVGLPCCYYFLNYGVGCNC
jgi:hypothetical protein